MERPLYWECMNRVRAGVTFWPKILHTPQSRDKLVSPPGYLCLYCSNAGKICHLGSCTIRRSRKIRAASSLVQWWKNKNHNYSTNNQSNTKITDVQITKNFLFRFDVKQYFVSNSFHSYSYRLSGSGDPFYIVSYYHKERLLCIENGSLLLGPTVHRKL